MAALDGIGVAILAGGLSSRLQTALPGRQKVLAPVRGEPFLARPISYLAAAGARCIVLALGYHADQVMDYVKKRTRADVELVPSIEPRPMGTGGALRMALPKLPSKTVLVMNGDSFIRADLDAFVAFHREREARVSVALTFVDDVEHYGVVRTRPDGVVTAFEEKPERKAEGGYVNAGMYLMARSVIEAIPPDEVTSLERDVFPGYCDDGLYGMKHDAPFIDIGTVRSWRSADAFFARLDREERRR